MGIEGGVRCWARGRTCCGQGRPIRRVGIATDRGLSARVDRKRGGRERFDLKDPPMPKQLAIVALLAAGAVAACTPNAVPVSSTGPNPWTHHAVLRWAENSEPDTFTPEIGNSQTDVDL